MFKTLAVLSAVALVIAIVGLVTFRPARAAQAPAVGSAAPGFTLKNQDGKDVSLKDYRGKWVVLYFYPKAFTPGCSMEAHRFEADSGKYVKKNAVILGVSVDGVEKIKSFCTKDKLGFTLLSDAAHKVSDLYGSTQSLLGFTLAARHTFLIDPEGIVRKAYLKVSPASHSAEVLQDLAGLQNAAKPADSGE